jgi:hypothetical protein
MVWDAAPCTSLELGERHTVVAQAVFCLVDRQSWHAGHGGAGIEHLSSSDNKRVCLMKFLRLIGTTRAGSLKPPRPYGKWRTFVAAMYLGSRVERNCVPLRSTIGLSREPAGGVAAAPPYGPSGGCGMSMSSAFGDCGRLGTSGDDGRLATSGDCGRLGASGEASREITSGMVPCQSGEAGKEVASDVVSCQSGEAGKEVASGVAPCQSGVAGREIASGVVPWQSGEAGKEVASCQSGEAGQEEASGAGPCQSGDGGAGRGDRELVVHGLDRGKAGGGCCSCGAAASTRSG